MIIKEIKIQSSEGKRTFSFSTKNIIFSKKNSVGKSTLLRILFYGLGYPIPSTYKMKFKKLKIWVTFQRDNNSYQSYRYFDYLELKKNGEIFYTDPISSNLSSWYSLIWGIDSLTVLDNLLGAIYLEQDKGWTLLNRGKIIGNISFNIRDLLIGLSKNNSEILNMISEKNRLKQIKEETKAILKLSEYTNYSNEPLEEDIEVNEEDLNKYKNLKIQERFLKTRINELKRTIKRTNSLENYIYSLNLLIKNPIADKPPIVVNKKSNNLMNFNSTTDYLKTELIGLQLDLNDIQKQRTELDRKMDEDTNSLFRTEDVVQSSLKALSHIKINRELIEKKQDSLDKELDDLNKNIDEEFKKNKEILSETEAWIRKFAKILGIEDVINSHRDYLFTHDIKSISGTQYYKVVFCFKMAYIKVIENHTQTCLPIILDSPSGREVTKSNIEKVIRILNEDFEKNQIIIASIFDYNLKNKSIIEIKNKIFELNNIDRSEIELLKDSNFNNK